MGVILAVGILYLTLFLMPLILIYRTRGVDMNCLNLRLVLCQATEEVIRSTKILQDNSSAVAPLELTIHVENLIDFLKTFQAEMHKRVE